MMPRILCGDIVECLGKYGENVFDGCLCDPPYGLGFMGRNWDGVVPDVDVWAEVLRVLKPGAFLLAFGGTRTWHRLACAIEDAGFELRDTLMWVYGCLSDDTEILTSNGWKTYDKLSCGSTVMCYNVSDNQLEWGNVQEVFTYEISDTAYHIESDSTDQIVTRNHRCLVERRGVYTFQLAERAARERKISVPILESMPGMSQAVPSAQSFSGFQEQMLRSKMYQRSHRAIQERDGQASIETRGDDQAEMPYLWRDVLQSQKPCREGKRKLLFPEMQWDSTGARMEETCPQGTGGMDRGKRTILQRKDEWSEQSRLEGGSHVFQNQGELQGCQVREMPRQVSGNGAEGWLCDGTPLDCSPTPGTMPQEIGSCPSRRPRSDQQRSRQFDAVLQQHSAQEIRGVWRTRPTLATITPIHYNGIVWCVRVPTGAFVVRRNGHVFVTGNSGFPKSHDISKAIDKRRAGNDVIRPWLKSLGNKEEIAQAAGVTPRQVDHWLGENTPCPQTLTEDRFIRICQHFQTIPCWADEMYEQVGRKLDTVIHARSGGDDFAKIPLSDANPRMQDITTSATPAAQLWDGYGTALKPAWEPIILAQKPRDGTFAENALTWGCGGIWVDGCRIAHNEQCKPMAAQEGGNKVYAQSGRYEPTLELKPQGRWPANLLLSHAPECECVGVRRVKGSYLNHECTSETQSGHMIGKAKQKRQGYADSDSLETIPDWRCVEGCPCRILGEQSGERTSGEGIKGKRSKANTYGNPTQDLGTYWASSTGTAVRFFYQAKASRSERNDGLDDFYWRRDKSSPIGFTRITHDEWEQLPQRQRAQGNIHPTVKPLGIIEYIAKLIMPPECRKLLVPFSGSGSEALGALKAGWDRIVCIDIITDYNDIARARIRHFLEKEQR